MGVLTAAQTASIGSVSFFEITSGSGLSGAPLDEIGNVYHIPDSDTNVKIDQGLAAREWEILAGVDSSQLTSLEGIVGTTVTLVWHRGTWSSVELKGLGVSEKTLGFNAYKVPLKLRKL